MRKISKRSIFAVKFKVMTAQTPYDQRLEQAFQTVEERDVVVLHDVHGFHVYGDDFILPCISICLNLRGVAHLRFDQHETTFHTNEVAVIPSNHVVHALDNNEDYTATIIYISKELAQEVRTTSFDHAYQKFHIRPSLVLTPQEIQKLQDITQVLEMVASPDMHLAHRREVLVRMIQIFIEVLNSFRKDPEETKNLSREMLVFNKFMDSLAKHYTTEHEVQYYAQELNLTPKYFSKIVSTVTGRGANAWINEYVINKAKNMLQTRPDMSLQRIGLTLGYPEQASFTRFFHKQTGMSPRAFRDGNHAKK